MKIQDLSVAILGGHRMVNLTPPSPPSSRRGVAAVTGKLPAFILLAQETEFPYACSLHGLSNASLEIAEAMADRALREFRECKATCVWPGYPSRICYHEPAAWRMNQHMAMMEGEG